MNLNLIVLVSSLFFYGQSLYVSAAPDVKVEQYTKYERLSNGKTSSNQHVKVTARDSVSIKNIELNRGGCELLDKWNPGTYRREPAVPVDLNFGEVFDVGSTCESILEISIDFGDQKKVYKFE